MDYRPDASEDARAEAAVWQAMVLFSTLQTAAEVWRGAKERRAGHDPTEQEAPAFARGYLRRALADLQALLLRLRASLVHAQHHADVPIAALVRRFHDLSALHEAAGLLHPIHQRLLSLYPDVPEALIEDARRLHRRASDLLDHPPETLIDQLGLFAEDALLFVTRLHRALTTSR